MVSTVSDSKYFLTQKGRPVNMEEFDLTNRKGLQKANRWLSALGWFLFPEFQIIKYTLNLFERVTSNEDQANIVEQLISKGKEKGVKKMKIKINKNAGINLGTNIDGIPINAKVGVDGTIEIEVEYQ